MRRATSFIVSGVLLAGTLAAVGAASTGPAFAAAIPDPGTAALAAESAVAARPAELFVGADDTLVRTSVQPGGNGLYYSAYERTYRGLPVIGGDSVVVTNAAGAVLTMVAAQDAVLAVDTTPTANADAARGTAQRRLASTASTSVPRLVVLAEGKGRLAWETGIAGTGDEGQRAVQTVYVDAKTGEFIRARDGFSAGNGNGFYSGNVAFGTSGSGTSFTMTDPARPNQQCGVMEGPASTGADDTWGNGAGGDLESACVDAMYAAGKQWDMASTVLGRNGIDGQGHAYPLRVGFTYTNAYFYYGSLEPGPDNHADFGRSSDGLRQLTSLDIVGHELGHGIFDSTGGQGGSGTFEFGGLNEGTGDIMGTLTEWFANNPNDPLDYDLAEEADFYGSGPIRRMYDPASMGDPGCYSAAAMTEEHAAAGPLNHWFYLLARGNNPAGGPTSPICAGGPASITGIGIQAAARVFYNALLMKTSSWLYRNVRVATLTAAKNLYPGSCAVFNTVRNAWNGVAVGAQLGEPTCTAVTGTFSETLSPTSRSVARGSSTTVNVTIARTSGSNQTVNLSVTGLPPGTRATFNPVGVGTGGSSTLTLQTNTATPTGNFTVTVVATGTSTRTATLTLTVTGCASPGQKLANPGFESGAVSWTTAGAFITNAGQPPHGGSWFAWLNGYGQAMTDTLSQTVALPAGCTNYIFSFWLHVGTYEVPDGEWDRLTVQVFNTSGTPLATLHHYTNLDASDGYIQPAFNLAPYAGQTVELRFTGVEDSIAATSFVVDDAALTVS